MSNKYARGGDLSKVPKAADVPAADLKTLLAADSSNPFLRALRIQQGFLKVDSLPVDLRGRVPTLPTEKLGPALPTEKPGPTLPIEKEKIQ